MTRPGEKQATTREWDESLGGFVAAGRDALGRRHGPARVYREDGSLVLEGHYDQGLRQGLFRGYHPKGEVAFEAHYVDDKPEGVFTRYRADSAGAIPLRSCCVPVGARELRLRYQAGQALAQSFHDAHGRPLCSDGVPWPAHPPGVAADAEFEETRKQWLYRPSAELTRFFDLEGNLVEETELERGKLCRRRRYGTQETLLESIELDDKGRPHGAYYRRYPGRAPYRDLAVEAEAGQFEHGRVVGAWRYLGQNDAPLYARERGQPLSAERLRELASQPLADAPLGELTQLSQRKGLVREALWFAARAAGRAASHSPLDQVLESLGVPLIAGQAAAWPETLGRVSTLDGTQALDALLAGADPVRILRLMVALLPEGCAAAVDLANAAVAMSEHEASPRANGEARQTRAMLRVARGDLTGATEDARAAEAQTKDGQVVATVAEIGRILYGGFRFAPDQEDPPLENPALPLVEFEQPVERLRQVLGLYATRLAHTRQRISHKLEGDGLGPHPSWLPPQLEILMPEGPLELRKFRASIEDEDDTGRPEVSEVEVDEQQGLLDPRVLGLLSVAHADWDALCWLCWSVGLSKVALPTSIQARPSLPTAINDAMLRCYRANDQLKTGGLVARSKQLPGFSWRGLELEAVPRALLGALCRQYLERRAVFFWLMFPQNVSPFQADLRQA